MNRVLADTGAKYPIIQAPMGWIAVPNWHRRCRGPAASAMAAAFALGAEGIQMGTLSCAITGRLGSLASAGSFG